MAPHKRVTDDVTFKGKAKAIAGDMTSKLTDNQPRVEDIDSISLKSRLLVANRLMLYKMKQMKKQQ